MEKRWKLLPTHTDQTNALQQALKVHPAICRLLVQRHADIAGTQYVDLHGALQALIRASWKVYRPPVTELYPYLKKIFSASDVQGDRGVALDPAGHDFT